MGQPNLGVAENLADVNDCEEVLVNDCWLWVVGSVVCVCLLDYWL